MRVVIRTWSGVAGTVRLASKRAIPDRAAGRLLDGLTVVEPKTFAVLNYEDGERYLRALPYNLAGTRVWATSGA